MSTYAIGDVHGCTRTLRGLLDRLPLDRAHDRLWLVGDIVGHGPDSRGALRLVRELEGELGSRLARVLGNHDLRLLAARAGAEVPRKVENLLARILDESDGPSLLDWLGHAPLLHQHDALLMVHAGLFPWWTVDEAGERASEVESILASARSGAFLVELYRRDDDRAGSASIDAPRALETARVMTTIRTIESDGTLCKHNGAPESAAPGCVPWFAHPDRAHRDATVVFGHWAALGLRIGPDWLALDSGCAWGGPLTAVRIEDRSIYQTPRLD